MAIQNNLRIKRLSKKRKHKKSKLTAVSVCCGAARTKFHRLGGFNIGIVVSLFWRLEIPDQSVPLGDWQVAACSRWPHMAFVLGAQR